MPWLREDDRTHTEDTLMYGMTWEQLQLLLKNDRSFMQPEDVFGELTPEEKIAMRKKVVRRIAKQVFRQSERAALELVDEYMDDLIELSAPREKVIDGDVKTFAGWMDSDVENFEDYVKENDKVDYDFVMHFAECVPPRTYNGGMIQCGEPHSHAREGARYATFIYLYKDDNYGGQVWMYKGNCLAGTCKKGTDIQIA